VKDEGIEEAIKSAINEVGLEFVNREIGFFYIDDLLQNNFAAKVCIGAKEITLEEYFLEREYIESKAAENSRYVVRGNLKEVSEDSWG
jgi:hypothetical protein